MTINRSVGRRGTAEDTFRALFAAHYSAVYGYAVRRVGSDEAADVAAETFAVAWRRRRSVPDEPATLLWLYGVARRVVANTRRSHRRRRQLTERIEEFEPTTPVIETDLDLTRALDQLSDKDREILLLAAWEGLDPSGLGDVLGCSPNTAAVRLHRARRRLEDVMQGGAE